MDNFHARIHLNLSAPLSELNVSVQRVTNLVSLGLKAVKGMHKPEVGIPGAFMSFSPAPIIEWNEFETKDEFSRWVLVNGFRDAVECINTCLESFYQVVCVWKLKERKRANGKITGNDWNDLIVSAPKRFHCLGLPDKIGKLEKDLAVDIPDSITDEVITVNQARNCLVHRNGIISEKDKNCPDGLEVKWKIIRVGYSEKGKEIIISEPMKLEKGIDVIIRFDSSSKLFPYNTKIKFSPEEFCDLVWTVVLFGRNIAKIVDDYGKINGHIIEKL